MFQQWTMDLFLEFYNPPPLIAALRENADKLSPEPNFIFICTGDSSITSSPVVFVPSVEPLK